MNTLGIGKVYKQGISVSRFIVQDKKGLELICALFNGNIVLHSKSAGRGTGQILCYFSSYKFNEIADKGKIIINKIEPIYF